MDNLKALKKSVFYISFPFSFIAFFFPMYAYSSGISIMEVGLMYSAFTLFTIIMRPAVGVFIDKKGRKPAVVLGIAFYFLVNILFILGKEFQYFMAIRVLQGIASTFLWIGVNTIISDLSHNKNRAEIFGTVDESINKGEIIGIILGIILVSYSFRHVFILYLITSLISLYYAVSNLRETRDLKVATKDETIETNKSFNMFLILMGTFSFIFTLTAPTYLIYIMNNITDKISLIGYIFYPGAILSMFLPTIFGKMSDKLSRDKVFLLANLAMGILYISIPTIKSYVNFLILHTLISVVSMFKSPAESALVIDVVGENQRGRAYGKYKFAIGIGAMLGPLVGSYIYENIGSKIAFFIKGILIIILSVFSAIFFKFSEVEDLKNIE